MTILDEIVNYKRKEVELRKRLISESGLMQINSGLDAVPSLYNHIIADDKTGIIAEFKRQSPSKGIINKKAVVTEVAQAYEQAGVSGMSVLTDSRFFGGLDVDLNQARQHCNIPLLRKDFIVDEFQIKEARAIGASAILLIASILTKEEVAHFTSVATDLGLEILFEIHDEEEIEKLNSGIKIVGINNRDLKTFKVDIEQSIRLAKMLPQDAVKIAESGIGSIENLLYLKQNGFDGFLIGENFMKHDNPGQACIDFCNTLRATL